MSRIRSATPRNLGLETLTGQGRRYLLLALCGHCSTTWARSIAQVSMMRSLMVAHVRPSLLGCCPTADELQAFLFEGNMCIFVDGSGAVQPPTSGSYLHSHRTS